MAKTKKEYEKQIERIRELAKKWGWIATEYGWNFDLLYCDKYEHMPRETSNERTFAIVFAKFDYLYADIYFNLEIASELEDGKLEESFIHELTHLLVRPIIESNDMEEYTVTTISRILMRMRASLEQENEG